jgi:hypothetical protein
VCVRYVCALCVHACVCVCVCVDACAWNAAVCVRERTHSSKRTPSGVLMRVLGIQHVSCVKRDLWLMRVLGMQLPYITHRERERDGGGKGHEAAIHQRERQREMEGATDMKLSYITHTHTHTDGGGKGHEAALHSGAFALHLFRAPQKLNARCCRAVLALGFRLKDLGFWVESVGFRL